MNEQQKSSSIKIKDYLRYQFENLENWKVVIMLIRTYLHSYMGIHVYACV